MLRIRPTSIGLSERDVDLHFHQINLYRSLRREGYSKGQVRHFYEIQQRIKQEQENDPDLENSSPQSTPEPLKVGGKLSLVDPSLPANVKAFSPQSSPPQFTHSVRQSSLLRFAQNASATSGSPEGTSITDFDPTRLVQSSQTHTLTYRPRSQTYPWIESEAEEEPASESPAYQYPVDELANLTLERPRTPCIAPMSEVHTVLRAEACEFTPLALPSPVGSPFSQPSSQPEHQAEILRIAPILITRGPPITPPRRSSLANQLLPSSGSLSDPASSSRSLPAALPVTPSPVRIRLPSRTEPRTYDASAGRLRLPIYDDRLAPNLQPQTPADLARRPILTDRDTVYTAPPGSMGRRLRTTGNDTSPTTRGHELRQRWTREYQRAEVVERERANEQRAQRMLWLEEWAADRVGEENA